MTPTAEQLTELRALGAATVHEAQGGAGALDSAIKPLHPGVTLAGPAFTVDCKPADNLAIQYAVTAASPGDVLVVDAKGFIEAGPWGDLLTLYAQHAGLAGIVIDGSVRDSRAIGELGFATFSRGVCIKGTAKNQPGAVNVPIVCGGVSINPGDVVVGDADGVVAVPAARVEEVLRAARTREEKEEGFRSEIRNGANLVDLLGLGRRITELGYR